MRIKVHFFAHFRQITGHKTLEVELEPGQVDVRDLLRLLLARFPGLQEYITLGDEEVTRRTVLVVVADRLVAGDKELEEGDEVKILPPIVGGSGNNLEEGCS